MPHYHQGNVWLEPPTQWEETTIVSFAPPRPPGGPPAPSIKMWKEALRPGDTVQSHTNRMLVKLANELPDFNLVASEETVVGGRRAALLRFCFKSGPEVIEQTRIAVDPSDDPRGTVFVFMAAATAEEADSMRASFFEVLRSVRFEAADVVVAQVHAAPPAPAARPSQYPPAPLPAARPSQYPPPPAAPSRPSQYPPPPAPSARTSQYPAPPARPSQQPPAVAPPPLVPIPGSRR